ncbi:MAG: hypothetical protein IPH31_22045 [Lewinellaceae bacterium]|nr:hypothetical protein [Lewinellaceae bacterium]
MPKIVLSQPECQFNDARAEVTTPIELGICDLTFPVPVIVIHDYPVAHDFTIVIYFNPNFVTLASSGALTNVTTSNGTNSNLIVTGTFTVPFDENFSAATLELAFNRVRTDYYGGMRIVVYDANCGTDPVAILNNIQVQSDPPMVNLSPFTSNLSTLIALGILDDCPAPGCISAPNVLVDDLDVNTNYAFDRTGAVTGSIVLLPGATITVLSGRTLTINNYDIFACGGELGQGIIVEPGATLVLNGCNISDCRFGIDVQAGATVSVKNCNFANNYVGARFNMTAAPFRAAINSFENNNFYGDSPLKAPFSGMPELVEERGYCGILVSRYMDFNIWGGNDFYALANGIIATNTTGNLGNMTFNDIQSTGVKRYEREGIGIHVAGYGTNSYMNLNDAGTTMTFNDCKTGIQGFYNGGDVENVTMTNVDIGIDWALSQTRQVTFLGNTITARKYGIRSSFNEPTDFQSIIYENTIVVTGSGAGTSPATGILVNEGGLGQKPENGWNIDVNQVTMHNGGRGIQYRNGSVGFCAPQHRHQPLPDKQLRRYLDRRCRAFQYQRQ